MNLRSNSLYLIISTILVIVVIYLVRSTISSQANALRSFIWKQKTTLSNEEKQTLQEQLYAFKFEIVKLRNENAALRMQLEAPLSPELGLLPARIVGNSRYLFIDQGKASGVKAGSAVVSQEILIGTVMEVGEHSSKIKVLTDPESKIPVRTQSGALGLLQGGDNKLMLTRILQSETLKIGDLVGTSGAEGLPGGILIGVINQLLDDKVEVYQQAVISPSIDYQLLTFVFVVM
ncbi:hypothetical protein COW99_03975 [Candidatus Roizmanbacteria bacterium CG22_combo_CG10-13_8_21_14_all_38_20]|uniref:Cell shape-determining protein MreC n=1 Tax=Candidatus Roizmanbacteria bacterium CG22_combo_CG10-13_8_21_14_all_38_20 TaxID=1974862 RepID=A0A2H0BUS6_9BACT|nr:rod shape-determining protein MreC [Candidatus Microgenomates bacterium]PIP61432.1 MAG: hypothetical protein COW99_03975 [Candidatus Roizmanbacteria bacterium CG22_combo_CG10-13_8_21_14_all_38_20]PJC32348.1 MAG: hypothetical protein CO050_00285 [Candidatus Roizmanbacteria bacterium CG_4_9_14_0_2_um_filter_38_17]